MGYSILLTPYFLTCFGAGLGLGVLALLLGTAPFVVPLFLGMNGSFYLCVALLGTVGLLSFFSKLRENIEWKEIFRVGLFFFLGAGSAFYFSFPFYFRYSGLFLFISALVWLLSLPFLPKNLSNRQFLFFPFFSNVFHGLFAGLVVGGLGLAGLPLLIPFLQIFRKMDRSAAASTSVPLSALSLLPMAFVLSLHPATRAPLQADQQMFLLAGIVFSVGLLLGMSFGKKLVRSLSPLVISLIQIISIFLMCWGGFQLVKSSLPCFSHNPMSCLTCFKGQSQKMSWDSFDWHSVLKDPTTSIEVVIDSCGYPLGFYHPSDRSDLVLESPNRNHWVGLNKINGTFSDTWEGLRTKRVKKHRVYFTKENCKGEAAISKRKLETQPGTTTIFNGEGYRDVKGSRTAFWYLSYRDALGDCISQSGMIKSSSDIGVFDLSSSDLKSDWGVANTEDECCHKFSKRGHFESTLYYADDDCQSPNVATDDEGPGKSGKSVIHHQDKYYVVLDTKPFFEFKSLRSNGKDCVKQEGILSPNSERLAYSLEEIPQPFDFSKRPPLSIRRFQSGDFELWLGKH